MTKPHFYHNVFNDLTRMILSYNLIIHSDIRDRNCSLYRDHETIGLRISTREKWIRVALLFRIMIYISCDSESISGINFQYVACHKLWIATGQMVCRTCDRAWLFVHSLALTWSIYIWYSEATFFLSKMRACNVLQNRAFIL